MAVALMFASRAPKPGAGPAAAALTLPRPRDASSPAPAGGCAEPRARRRAASSPPLLSRRLLPLLPLSPPAHGLLRGCKMDYSDPPGLLRRRVVPRTGKHSAPLGLAAGTPRPRTVPHRGAGSPVLLPRLVTCPSQPLILAITIAIIIIATVTVAVIAIVIIGVVIINNSCGHAAGCVRLLRCGPRRRGDPRPSAPRGGRLGRSARRQRLSCRGVSSNKGPFFGGTFPPATLKRGVVMLWFAFLTAEGRSRNFKA